MVIHPKVCGFLCEKVWKYVKRHHTDALIDLNWIWENRNTTQFYFLGFREGGTDLGGMDITRKLACFRNIFPSCDYVVALDVWNGKFVDVTNCGYMDHDARWFLLNEEAQKC